MAYDVFISFKNTAPGGDLTVDRIIAERLYLMLREEGLKVFLSEKEVDRAEFMSQVYGALDGARMLVLVGSSKKYIDSKWVKSEWQNYLGSINSGRNPNGQIVTVLYGISPRDLPIEISNMQSFPADNIKSAVDFVVRSLGRAKDIEAAPRKADASTLPPVLTPMSAPAPSSSAPAPAPTPVPTVASERPNNIVHAPTPKKAEKRAGIGKNGKIIAAVLAAALIIGAVAGGIAIANRKPGNGPTMDERQEEIENMADDLREQEDSRALDDIYDFAPVEGGYEIERYYNTRPEKELVLPMEYKGEPVVSIGENAFEKRYSLESITIPISVTSIGNGAFTDCTSLIAITIPEGVTSIGNGMFWNCVNLKSVVIPNSVTSIGGSAFYGCTSLKSIIIPEGVTSIEGSAFSDCTGLTSITVPDSVTKIGDAAFGNCISLTSIAIPDSVTSIGFMAFWNCPITVHAPHDPSYYGYEPDDGVTWITQ